MAGDDCGGQKWQTPGDIDFESIQGKAEQQLLENRDCQQNSLASAEHKSVVWWQERYKLVAEQLEHVRLQLLLTKRQLLRIETERKSAESELIILRKQHASLLFHISEMTRDEERVWLNII